MKFTLLEGCIKGGKNADQNISHFQVPIKC